MRAGRGAVGGRNCLGARLHLAAIPAPFRGPLTRAPHHHRIDRLGPHRRETRSDLPRDRIRGGRESPYKCGVSRLPPDTTLLCNAFLELGERGLEGGPSKCRSGASCRRKSSPSPTGDTLRRLARHTYIVTASECRRGYPRADFIIPGWCDISRLASRQPGFATARVPFSFPIVRSARDNARVLDVELPQRSVALS